jgi:tetratricopeptide (TPR) repeat protein
MTRGRISRPAAALVAAAALCGVAGAVETITYATPQGEIRSAEVVAVTKDELKDFSARVREGGRRVALNIPSRLVIAYRKGDEDDPNPWSKRLAKAYRLMAEGRYLTRDNVPGAEELLQGIAVSTERGVPGVEPIDPAHNMYALFHLIQARYEAGKGGKDAARLAAALRDVEQFLARTEKRKMTLVEVELPSLDAGGAAGAKAAEGPRKVKVFAWGDSRLVPEVLLMKARLLRESGKLTEAAAAFDEVVKLVQKNELSPLTLAAAILEKSEMEAAGKSTQDAESILRTAGNALRAEISRQKEPWSQSVVAQAGNRALLRGADLLLESAEKGQNSHDVPLARYRELLDGPGKDDPFLAAGARTGIGVCLYASGKGKEAYTTLLDVAVRAAQFPELTARALYYVGLAAPLYAREVESNGGSGALLREDGARWWGDLRERFPESPWSRKTESGKEASK